VTYLLDTMMVSFFLQAGREGELASAAKCLPMAIVDEVRIELEGDRSRGGAPFRKWLASSNLSVRAIEVGSPASVTLTQLRSAAVPSKNLGERASIALAASDPSLTFVTHDKGGMWIALRELWAPGGEHILGIAPFLRRLLDQGAVGDPDVLDDVIDLAVAPAQRPTWWAAWRAGLLPQGAAKTETEE